MARSQGLSVAQLLSQITVCKVMKDSLIFGDVALRRSSFIAIVMFWFHWLFRSSLTYTVFL